jgi:hypothetical protein
MRPRRMAARLASTEASRAATRSLLNGTDFGDNIRAVLPDVIASTIGNAVAVRVNADLQARQARIQAVGALAAVAVSIDPTLTNTAEGRASLAALRRGAGQDYAALQRLPDGDKRQGAALYDKFLDRLGDLPLSAAGRAVLKDAFNNVLGQRAPGEPARTIPDGGPDTVVTAVKYGSVAGPLDRLGDQAGQLLKYTDGQVANFMDRNPAVRAAAQIVGVGLMVVGGPQRLAAGLVFDKFKGDIQQGITETYQAANFSDGTSTSIASGQTWLASTAIGGAGLLKLGMAGVGTAKIAGAESAGAQALALRRLTLNEKFGRTGNLNNDINLRGYMSQVETLDISTNRGAAIFYSGPGNRGAAEAFAQSGGATLEMTPGGAWLDSRQLFKTLPPELAQQPWDRLSQRYAQSSSGSVSAFIDGASKRGTFYRVELPALQANPDVNLLLRSGNQPVRLPR